MADELSILKREHESAAHPLEGRVNRRAKQALDDYLQLGTRRSLALLHQRYAQEASAPTRRLVTLNAWFERFDWQAQADCFDQEQMDKTQAADDPNRETGLALNSQRVTALKKLYQDLLDLQQLLWPIWMSELQQGTITDGERGLTQRFNLSLVSQMRGVLDDLARETGGRASRAMLAVTSPNQTQPGSRPDLSLLDDEELGQLKKLLQKATPGFSAGFKPRQPGLPGFASLD